MLCEYTFLTLLDNELWKNINMSFTYCKWFCSPAFQFCRKSDCHIALMFFPAMLLNWLWERSIDNITKDTLLLFLRNPYFERRCRYLFLRICVSKNLILVKSVKIKQKQRNKKECIFCYFLFANCQDWNALQVLIFANLWKIRKDF